MQINVSQADAQSLDINKIDSGLIVQDPLNDQTLTKEQLEQDNYWRFGGSAEVFNTEFDFYQNSTGLTIGVKGIPGYSGYYALTPTTDASVFHSVVKTPYDTIPSDFFQNGLYVQTFNGLVTYVSCVSITSTAGTSWHVIRTLGDQIEATVYEVLWSDYTPNPPLERDCTIITNGDNYLKVILDNVKVYESNTLDLQMPGPFLTFIEVQSSYDDFLYGVYSDFYIASDENILVENLPAGATRVELVDLQNNTLESTSVANGVSSINIALYDYPLNAKIIAYDDNDIELASTQVPVSIWGGDVYSTDDPPPPVVIDPVIEVISEDMVGNPIIGLWTEFYENNQLVSTGFTPVTYTATMDSQYLVAVGDYQDIVFDHWEDGSQVRIRGVTAENDVSITATYQIGPPPDTLSPIILLNGANPVTLEISVDAYTEDGASVTDNDPAYAGTVSIGGDLVDANTVGTYIVTYDAPADAAGNIPVQITRTVNVVDTLSPVITLNGVHIANLVTLEVGADTYTEEGASVIDNDPTYSGTVSIGGDLVDANTVGTYIVTYDAPADPSGNLPSQVTRTVDVIDSTSPIISLNGVNPVTLEISVDTYTEDGASVTDNDPAYTGTVSIGGDLVDANTVGTYIVTYDAPADAAGNIPVQITRTVNVVGSVPDSPTGLTANIISTSQINLSWNAPSNDGGSAIIDYEIERQIETGSWITIVSAAGAGSSYSDTGLTPNTTYNYRVSAINSIGTGPTSNIASATTPLTQSIETLDNGKNEFVTTGWINYINLVKFTGLTPGSQIDKVALNVDTPEGNIRYKVYQDDGVGGNPSTLLAQSNSIPAQIGAVYNSLTSPATVPASGNVWVGFETDSSALAIHYGAGLKKHTAHTYGNGPSPIGTVGTNSFEIWAGIEMITTISSSNTPPGASDDSVTTNTNTPIIIDVLQNDYDDDGDTLSVSSIFVQPISGTVIINPDGTILYTPDTDFTGADNFDYMISDGQGGSDTALVSVTILP